MLALKNITKEFKETKVLKNLNIEFKSGLNFIVGPSGSGKSTLLKIMSGIDKDYDGEVLFKGRSLKNFNNEEINNYFANSVGFIWQNFQLISHLSVEDNVKMVLELTTLSSEEKNTKVNRILKSLGIDGLSKKSVSKLSGGQKQRVAIARALVKNPEVIIADEPTGALDKKTSLVIMNILKKISKERIVIVVTHDKSLIDGESNSFLLNKGGITQISSGKEEKVNVVKENKGKNKLSILNSFYLGGKNFKGLFMKFIMTSLILVLSSYFLLLNLSGTVGNEQEKILNDLISSSGESLKDINIYSDVIGAGGTGENNSNKKPTLDLKQNVAKVLSRYKDDPRVEYVVPLTSVNDMVVNIDGVAKNHRVESSGTAPFVNKVVEGRMPQEGKREVAVTKKFLKSLNKKPSDVIGKKLSVKGTTFDWSSGEAKEKKTELEGLTIVGVIDSTISYTDPKYGKIEYEIEDAFIYGFDVVKEITGNKENLSFTMRVKDVKDVMTIVSELNKEGITPMGEFEKVSDILSINTTTKDQSKGITIIMGAIALIVTITVVVINGVLRKGEFSILKLNGYTKGSIFKLNVVEYLMIALTSVVIFLLASPLIDTLGKKMFSISASGKESLIIGVGIILVQGIAMGIISSFITSNAGLQGER